MPLAITAVVERNDDGWWFCPEPRAVPDRAPHLESVPYGRTRHLLDPALEKFVNPKKTEAHGELLQATVAEPSCGSPIAEGTIAES